MGARVYIGFNLAGYDMRCPKVLEDLSSSDFMEEQEEMVYGQSTYIRFFF